MGESNSAQISARSRDQLPSYSPIAPRMRRTRSLNSETSDVAPAWPATFEQGVDLRMASPAAMQRRSITSPFSEKSPLMHPQTPLQAAPETIEEGDGAVVGQSSFRAAVFNSINVLLGVGVLSSPFSLRSGGVIVGSALFVFFTFITKHTALLLGRCLEYQEGMQTYPDIGEAAYGTRGRVIISITFFIELFTVVACFYVLIGDTLAALIPYYSARELAFMAFLVTMPTLWTTHLNLLSYFSIIGIISSFFCLYTVLYVGLAIDTEAADYTEGSLLDPQPVQLIAEPERIPLSIGLTMVAFGGHSVFPSICSSMQDRSLYPKAVSRAYLVVIAVYGAIELGGYLMFGVDTQKEITLNLVEVYPGKLTELFVWTIALNPMSKVALTIHPVALAVEELVLPAKDILDFSSRRVSFYRALIRMAIAGGALMCALYIPNFARLTSFLGSLFAMMVSVFFPCVFYIKLFRPELSKFQVCANYTLAAIALVFATIGTLSSFISPTE